jgi:hypothetical protein
MAHEQPSDASQVSAALLHISTDGSPQERHRVSVNGRRAPHDVSEPLVDEFSAYSASFQLDPPSNVAQDGKSGPGNA